VSDSVVLDYWNGRPSVWMSSSAGEPFLHWMVLGHTEDFEVWLHARLTWDVADKFASAAPLRLEQALALIPGAPVRIVLEDAGRPILFTDIEVPVRTGLVAAVMAPFVEAMEIEMHRHGRDEVLIKHAQRDVTDLAAV
jgi:hypothetical protein